MKAQRPGEMIQIDHMSVSRDGDTLKEFKATCPVSKQLVARVYSRATANNARRFLNAVREDLPFELRSIQVDGGSEFRRLRGSLRGVQSPPGRPASQKPRTQRRRRTANDSSRTEFWSLYAGDLTVKDASPALAEYQYFYNHVRPHCALDLMTPMEYLRKNRPAESGQSQMS